MAEKDRVQLIHPEGKKAPAISKKTYKLFCDGIKHALSAGKPLTYTELAEGMSEYIDKKGVDFQGSVEWFSVAVKQHLEAEGVISTYSEGGRKLHVLK